MPDFTIKSNLVDVVAKEIFPAEITVVNNKIYSIKKTDEVYSTFVLPGFIDSHVHIESSMLVPSEFAKIAVKHGTIGTISDPHEIANVLGIAGVDYMIDNAKQVPFHFYFGAPSCVPATEFETSGATIDSTGIDALLSKPEIVYLAEMMNFPGVIYKNEEVLKKIAFAKKHNKPIDGHAPGLMGDDMKIYFDAGISTDHECFKYDEALQKGAVIAITPQTLNYLGATTTYEAGGYTATIADIRVLNSFNGVGINSEEAIRLNTGTTIGTNVSKTVIGTSINLTATTVNTLFGTRLTLQTTVTVIGRDSGARLTIPVTITKTN